jgi:hypothetical protein
MTIAYYKNDLDHGPQIKFEKNGDRYFIHEMIRGEINGKEEIIKAKGTTQVRYWKDGK